MKIKERALAILLSMVMMLAFMPALAFAESEGTDTDAKLTVQDIEDDDVKSIEFSPSNISLYSEDIKVTLDNGTVIYPFDNRATTIYPDGTQATWPYAKGDQLIVHYNDGSTDVYTANIVYDEEEAMYDLYFTNSNGDWEWPSYDDGDGLKPGNNNVTISFYSASTTISIYLDTPEARAARAAEAARQGTPDKSLPKVKISKPKAAKKAATIKWKKLNKKQLKKSKAQKIEVWVCPNGSFSANDTIMKTAGKKKASLKVKGLKKGTYFVKVRAIKYVNGAKMVGPWSKVKKVKIKK